MFGHKEIIDLLVKGYGKHLNHFRLFVDDFKSFNLFSNAGADNTIRDYSGRTADDLLRINNKKILVKFTENSTSRKHQEGETKTSSLLARTASLRQTHKQLLDRLPSKYRTMK